MAGDYGNRNREDPPNRLINVPPQAAARNTLPRAVDAAIKKAQASTALQQILMLYQADASSLTGLALSSTTEGHAGTTTINSEYWWSEIKRFCRYVENTNGTGVNDKRLNRTGVALDISPIALLDPSGPSAPFVWRVEDICAARLVSPTSSHIGAFHFGITWENAIGVALTPPKPFIGIYANWTNAAYGTWTARCVNDSGSGLNQSLGITTELPHRLAYALDGRGQVIFSIDGVDLLTYDTTGSDLGTHTIFEIDHRWTVAADNGATIRGGYMMDLQTLITCEVLDEAA